MTRTPLSGLCSYQIRVDIFSMLMMKQCWLVDTAGTLTDDHHEATVFMRHPNDMPAMIAAIDALFKGKHGTWKAHAVKARVG